MAAAGHGWLGLALRRQSLAASLAIAGFMALGACGLRFSLSLQVGTLLAGIVLVGFPHGAFDHEVARPVLAPRLGRLWWGPFGFSYLSLAGMVWLAWTVAPLPTLGLFLAGSVLHFGLGDTEDSPASGTVPRWAGVLTYGTLPILLPVAFHPGQAAPLLAAIGGVAAPTMASALSYAIVLTPFWLAAFCRVSWAAGRRDGGFALPAITAAGFAVLPPLLAFGLYFGLVHSPRHLLRLGAWHDPHDEQRAARWIVRVLVPASIICALGIAGLALTTRDGSNSMLVPIFRIIAALTLPHMIVTAWLSCGGARSCDGCSAEEDAGHGGQPDWLSRLEAGRDLLFPKCRQLRDGNAGDRALAAREQRGPRDRASVSAGGATAQEALARSAGTND